MVDVQMPNGDLVAFPDTMPKAEIGAFIEKKFPNARRQALADTGVKPYDNMATTALKAAQGVPGNLQIGISGVTQQLAEGEAGDPNALIERIAKPDFRISQRPDIDEVNLIQWGRQKLGLDTSTPLTPEQTAQIEGLAKAPGGREEFGQYLLSGKGLGTNPKRVAMADIKGQLERAEINKGIPQLDVAPGSVESVIGNVVSSTAQMAPGYIASIATRNPGPAVALAEVLTSSQAYAEARDAGVSPDKAAQYAMANGFAEAVGEALPLSMILKEGGKLIPKLFKAGVSEAMQEGVTQLIQSGLQSGTISPDMTWKDVKDQIIAAAAAGATAGVLLGGATSALDTATGKKEQPTAESVSAEVLAKPDAEAPIEESTAPPTQTMLALPSPESFAQPDIKRRQPQLNATEEPSPVVENADYQARIALKRTRQQETAALLQTAKETVTPLGTFSPEDIGGEAAGRVKALRIQTGRPVEAPVTIEELARAKVPQKQIDAIITARRPMAQAETLSPLDIARAAAAKNIIATDSNFKDLAYRTTGQRDTSRMTQAQLNALKTTVDALPAHPAPVTVPLADAPSFTDDQYGKALDALRKQGRYTEKAIKDVTGLKSTKDVHAIRDTLVRRGQLVQHSPNDFRLYDVVGQERQAVPSDLPPGAFKEHVVTRLPVSRTRIRKDGTLLPDSFGSASEVREKISTIRESESKAGGKRSALKIEPAADVAYGVMENRYDEAGNLLGQVVVDTHRNESDAKASADKLNKVTDTVEQPSAKPLPVRKPPPPAVLAGRMKAITTNLNQLAKSRALPLLDTRVQLVSDITTPTGGHAEGQHLPLQNVIQLALSHLDPTMTDTELVDRLAQVMDHELIHALSRAGILGPNTDGWRTIARYARRAKRPGMNETYFEWANRVYNESGRFSTTYIEEEAIAEAFRHWAAARRNVTGKPGTVFAQLVEYIKRLLRAIPHDLFVSIETGSLVTDALRPPGSTQPRARAATAMAVARAGVTAAEQTKDENLVKTKGREFLRARAQAREDRLGRSGPKTVIGTTPTKAYATGGIANREGVKTLAEKYRTETGVTAGRLMTSLPEDVAYLSRVADAQQKGAHNPKADDVAKAYRALAEETRAMWRALGPVEVTAWTGEGPPYASPAEMFDDLAAGRLRIRLSKDLFGEGADNPGHPLYEASGYKTVDGKDLVLNDLFRVVHDVYGHGQSGFRDDPRGQYNAYHEHARLLSPEARRALATETLAQAAWANYGPHLRRRDGTVPRETDVDYLAPNLKEFAEQKAFLVPSDLLDADPGWELARVASEASDAFTGDTADLGSTKDTVRFSKFDESLPGGRLYGNPNRSPGGALSKPETPSPAFSTDRPGNRFFGGEMADHQLDMARTGARGAALIYMSPEDFLLLTGAPANPEQEVYDAASKAGYKFSTLPSLVISGYAGNVRATGGDGAYVARTLATAPDLGGIPVVLYPAKGESLGLVTALEGQGERVPMPERQENYLDARGAEPEYKITAQFGSRVPRYSIGDDEAFHLDSGLTGPSPNEDEGTAEPPPLSNDFNIIAQRVETPIGKALHKLGRSKTDVPIIGNILAHTPLINASNFFDWRIKYQDFNLAMKELEENVRVDGGKVTDENSFYVLQQAGGARAVHGIREREDKLYKPLIEAIERAGKERKGAKKMTLLEVEDALMARHVPERNAHLRAEGSKEENPAGMSDAEASAILDKVALDGNTEMMKEVAVKFDALNGAGLGTTGTRIEGGLLPPDIKSPYQYYAPLRNSIDSFDPEDPVGKPLRARSGKGYKIGGRENRPVTGRHTKAGDLIAHAILQNTEAVIRSEKARAGRAFLRFVLDNREALAPVVEIVTHAPKKMTRGADGRIKEIVDPFYRQDPSIFITKVAGKDVVLKFKEKDSRLARALNSDYVTQLPMFLRFMGNILRYQAQLNTTWNLAFSPVNLTRDLQQAGVLLSQYDIPKFTRNVLSGALAAARGIAEVQFKGTATGEYAEAFREMQKNGWTTEFLGIHDLETTYNKIRHGVGASGLKLTAQQAKNKIALFGKALDGASQVAENALRVSAYVHARRAGASLTQAGYLARNLTTNFNMAGENKALMSSLYLFYGATVQGPMTLMRGLKNKRVQKILGAVVAVGFVLDMINRTLSGDDNDNGVKDYDEIPEYVLKNNWILPDLSRLWDPTGKRPKYLKIPMPYMLNWFPNLGRNLSNMFSGSPAHSPVKSGISIFTSMLDNNPMGASNNFLNFVAPSWFDPVVDLGMTNRNYADAPIKPEHGFGPEVPDSQKFWNHTAEPYKDAAEGANALSGGNEVRKGMVDISPEWYEYAVQWMTGGAGTFISQMGGLGANAAVGLGAPSWVKGAFQDVDTDNIPFVNRFVGTIGNGGNTDMYYQNTEQMRLLAQEIKTWTDSKPPNLAAVHQTKQQHPVEVTLLPRYEATTKAVGDLQKQIRDTLEDPHMDITAKRAKEKFIQQKIDFEMAKFNKVFFAAHGYAPTK